ncbi:hypothetical protein [Rhizobium sp.]|jgi:hypothetical protein|uniref:hypothetical protein n=1 Tax=Rhizobium sp. TaxID=391 RepID=UPI000E9DBF20|nr:hypothetical protein [Rhizobium sp.]
MVDLTQSQAMVEVAKIAAEATVRPAEIGAEAARNNAYIGAFGIFAAVLTASITAAVTYVNGRRSSDDARELRERERRAILATLRAETKEHIGIVEKKLTQYLGDFTVPVEVSVFLLPNSIGGPNDKNLIQLGVAVNEAIALVRLACCRFGGH